MTPALPVIRLYRLSWDGLGPTGSRRPLVGSSVPWIRKAFGLRAGRGGLTLLETIERTAAPTRVLDALDAKLILGRCLGRSRTRRRGYTDDKQRQENETNIASPYLRVGGSDALAVTYAC